MWGKFLERLRDPRNLLNLVVLVAAVLGVFGIPQKQLGLTDQEVIVALLVFIIVEQFGTNLLYLASIDEKLDKVRMVASGIDQHFAHSRSAANMKSLIEKSTWMRVSGVTLDSFIINFSGKIEEEAERGTHFEFLLSDGNAKYLDELSPSRIYNGHKYRTDIGNAIAAFQGLSPSAKQRVQVKQSPKTAFASVIQAKLKDGTEYMTVEPYLYKIEGGAAKFLELERTVAPEVFAYYEQSENQRWNDAAPVSL